MTYKLYLGDCLDIMPTLDAGSIDAIITDLPYGTTACAWDTVIPFEPMWKEVKRLLKPNGVFITTSKQPFTSALIMSNPTFFKEEIIWEKERPTNIFNMKKKIGQVHENIEIFYCGRATYNPIMEKRDGNFISPEYDLLKLNNNGTETFGKSKFKYSSDYDSTKKYPRSVLYFVRDLGKGHPTKKPVMLYEYLIRTYTNENELVLDICMGGGTTIRAAENVGRNSIGIEKDENIFNTAKEYIPR